MKKYQKIYCQLYGIIIKKIAILLDLKCDAENGNLRNKPTSLFQGRGEKYCVYVIFKTVGH